MPERVRSKDGRSETAEILRDAPDTPSQQGRAQGNLERNVGTQDEEKRVFKGEMGKTRVTKEDERGQGGLGGHHGTGENGEHS